MKYIYYVLNFILHNRKSGTTTLIRKIAAENDCYIVVRFSREIESYKDVKDKCITLEQLFDFKNLPKKPILFESQAIKEMCELAKASYEVVKNQNLRRDALLKNIKQSLEIFESSGDIIGSVSKYTI